MDRFAVFVDAGYFFKAGADALQHTQNVSRKDVYLKNYADMLVDLADCAAHICGGMPLLRIYWYDAMRGARLSLEQSNLARSAYVKLRLGALNSAGEQKGVDSLIVTDLIDLARNKAIADAVIVSGDEDLRIAVQVAQSFGVRVHVLAVAAPDKNVSLALQMEADSLNVLDVDWLGKYLACAPAIEKQKASEDFDFSVVMTEVVEKMVAQLSPQVLDELRKHFEQSTEVPTEFDRPLLASLGHRLDRRLQGDESRKMRGCFVRAVRNKKDQ